MIEKNNWDHLLLKCEFDQWPHETGICFIRGNDSGKLEVVLKVESEEHVIISADRDQWGVWLNLGKIQVATEDGTRSFLDGLIQCLQELRKLSEFQTKDATKYPEMKETK